MPSRFPNIAFRLTKSFCFFLLEHHLFSWHCPYNSLSLFELLTFQIYQDILTLGSAKSVSSSLHRRRGPSPACPHSCSSVYTGVISHRPLSSYSAWPGSSTACPRRARSSIPLPWRGDDCERESKGRKPGSKSNGCMGEIERFGACGRRVEA